MMISLYFEQDLQNHPILGSALFFKDESFTFQIKANILILIHKYYIPFPITFSTIVVQFHESLLDLELFHNISIEKVTPKSY